MDEVIFVFTGFISRFDILMERTGPVASMQIIQDSPPGLLEHRRSVSVRVPYTDELYAAWLEQDRVEIIDQLGKETRVEVKHGY